MSIAAALLSLWLVIPTGTPPANGDSEHVARRMVKQFDFDERKFGNFESIPINWRRIIEPGFPRFLEPRFDLSVGHERSPSLYLTVSAGSSGMYYVAKDIAVMPGCDYVVTGWIRPQKLTHAAARLTAYYLDGSLTPLDAGKQSGELVRSNGDDATWRKVELRLSAGVAGARYIGLRCTVEQSERFTTPETSPRPIPHRDADAGAWFDDITVLRMPRVSLSAVATANAFLNDQPIELLACVADTDGAGLSAELVITDSEHRTLHTQPVATVATDHPGETLRLPPLAYGLYVATLRVAAAHGVMAETSLEFIRATVPITRQESPGAVGVALLPESAHQPTHTLRMLDCVSAGAIDVPLWHTATREASLLQGDSDWDQLLQASRKKGRCIRASLLSPPGTLTSLVKAPADTVFDLLSLPPSAWRAYLAYPLTRYGAMVDAWHVGDVFQPMPARSPTVAGAIRAIRTESQQLRGDARIESTLLISESPPPKAKLDSDGVTLSIPTSIQPDDIPDYLHTFEEAGYREATVALSPVAMSSAKRIPRLSDWARRIILARAAGAGLLLTPQPWRWQETTGQTTFDESLFISRTLSDALARLRSVGPVWMDHGVRAWLFADKKRSRGVLAVWTDGEDARDVTYDFGADVTRLDMWGNQTTVVHRPGGANFQVGEIPIILLGANPTRVARMAGFDVDSPGFAVQTLPQARGVQIANPGDTRMRGHLRLRPPSGWRVQPESSVIDVPAGATQTLEVAFIVPSNAGAGDYTLGGELEIDDAKPDVLVLRTPLHIGSMEAEMAVFSRTESDTVHVTQRITNLSDRPLRLRASLLIPTIARQSRLINSLAPGKTTLRDYTLPLSRMNGVDQIRASIEEIGGPVRLHRTIQLD
ncbi:MAG: hypothetical protein HZA51_14325 [Planctomycetes bacterium]|nr:hypothetical protein [Planctomycetota bacterium]